MTGPVAKPYQPPPRRYLPLRGRMLLLDAIVELRRGYARTRARLGDDHPFFEPGAGVPAWVAIELIAQSAGVVAGFEAEADGDPPPNGYLLGTRRFESSPAWFPAGTVLELEVGEAFVDPGNLAAYDGRVLNDGIEAGCRVTLYRRPREAT